MNLKRLEVKSFGTLEEVDIDFDKLRGVVAVTGGNGQGKTSLLRCIHAGFSLLRKRPPGKGLIRLTTDAFVSELAWTKSEMVATIYDVTGRPITDGKQGTHRDWMETRMPADLFRHAYHLPQATQTSEPSGFIAMDPAERRRFLAWLLGHSALQDLAKKAKTRADAADKQIDLYRGELVGLAQIVVGDQMESVSDAEARVTSAKVSLDKAQEEDRIRAKQMDLRRDLAALKTKLVDVPDRGDPAEWREELVALDREVERLAGLFEAGQEKTRLGRQAELLTKVPCGDEYPNCPLLKDAYAARGKLLSRDWPDVTRVDADLRAVKTSRGTCVSKLRMAEDGLRERVRQDNLLARVREMESALAPVPAPDVQAAADTYRKALERLASVKASEDRRKLITVRGERVEALGRAEVERGDWAVLAELFGPRGIQAALLEAGAPRLEFLLNDYLAETPFSASLALHRSGKRGGQEIETLDLAVEDGRKEDRIDAPPTYSGAEQVLLAESSALATCAVGLDVGFHVDTLLRDETAAALNEENITPYFSMLRKGMGLLGISRVLLVTHHPAIMAESDCRLSLQNYFEPSSLRCRIVV